MSTLLVTFGKHCDRFGLRYNIVSMFWGIWVRNGWCRLYILYTVCTSFRFFFLLPWISKKKVFSVNMHVYVNGLFEYVLLDPLSCQYFTMFFPRLTFISCSVYTCQGYGCMHLWEMVYPWITKRAHCGHKSSVVAEACDAWPPPWPCDQNAESPSEKPPHPYACPRPGETEPEGVRRRGSRHK